MANAAPSSDLPQCPMCYNVFQEPKILACAHLACKKCVLSWVKKRGRRAGCPICQNPIFPSFVSDRSDLATQVDALPTDMSIVAVVESDRFLRERPVCYICEGDVAADTFCRQCDIRLCSPCTEYHGRLPATRDHELEELGKLTVQRLAAIRLSRCNEHLERPSEMYCPVHQELICDLCAVTTHDTCEGVGTISDIAKLKRVELLERARRLREQESALAQEIDSIKKNFDELREITKTAFDDLQHHITMRSRQVYHHIEAAEEAAVTLLLEIGKQRASLKSNMITVKRLIVTSSAGTLLEMIRMLASRVEGFESWANQRAKVKVCSKVVFEPETLSRVKSAIETLGLITSGEATSDGATCCSSCGNTPQPVSESETGSAGSANTYTGAELAVALQVGDRVKRGWDWQSFDVDGTPPGLGTVTRIGRGVRTGLVRVRWDSGREHEHKMGLPVHSRLIYELELA